METHHAIYNSRNYQSLLAESGPEHSVANLQQQKLLELTSRMEGKKFNSVASTIVEIIRAYQPVLYSCFYYCLSTIVEIIRAYQPFGRFQVLSLVSTIVEIIRAYQPSCKGNKISNLSTIVEIIRAYQPFCFRFLLISIYNSRNYQSLLAFYLVSEKKPNLQQQKLLELTSHQSEFI